MCALDWLGLLRIGATVNIVTVSTIIDCNRSHWILPMISTSGLRSIRVNWAHCFLILTVERHHGGLLLIKTGKLIVGFNRQLARLYRQR